MIKIAVGTMSELKLKFMKNVSGDIGLDVEFVPAKVPSSVSEQPITDEETKSGSINRAKLALKEVKDVQVGLGIEVGYHKNEDNRYEIFC